MARRQTNDTKPKHEHRWKHEPLNNQWFCGEVVGYEKGRNGEDDTTKPLYCKVIKLTNDEYATRIHVWKDYYEAVRTSHPYERYIQQGIAYWLGDMAFVKGCALQAQKDVEENTPSMLKPPFPDPEIEDVFRRVWVE